MLQSDTARTRSSSGPPEDSNGRSEELLGNVFAKGLPYIQQGRTSSQDVTFTIVAITEVKSPVEKYT